MGRLGRWLLMTDQTARRDLMLRTLINAGVVKVAESWLWSDDDLAQRCAVTPEDLQALPAGTVVLDVERAVQEKFADTRWYQPAWTGGRTAYAMRLPAVVIHRPAAVSSLQEKP